MAQFMVINQGVEDPLLIDPSTSYFQSAGYTRTAPFVKDIKDIECTTGQPTLGQTATFVIPKAADMLGPCDLIIEMEPILDTSITFETKGQAVGWVEAVGHAMLEEVTFSIGTQPIEKLDGQVLNIINELMRTEEHRYGEMIGKTGRPLVDENFVVHSTTGAVTRTTIVNGDNVSTDPDMQSFLCSDRVVAYAGEVVSPATVPPTIVKKGKHLIVPLGLFFTRNPSEYFPIAAIAGSNEIRIQIKFRQANELFVFHSPNTAGTSQNEVDTDVVGSEGSAGYVAAYKTKTTNALSAAQTNSALTPPKCSQNQWFKRCVLRVHYVHLTGPEATLQMTKEHVRLMKFWDNNKITKEQSITCSPAGSKQTVNIPLNMMHPVSEIVVTIRKMSDINGTSNATDGKITDTDLKGQGKNYFAYYGQLGMNPNVEGPGRKVKTTSLHVPKNSSNVIIDSSAHHLKDFTGSQLLLTNIALGVNGNKQHRNGSGLPVDYVRERMMPMLHSNAKQRFKCLGMARERVDGEHVTHSDLQFARDIEALSEASDAKAIFVYPIALNPEGKNPSGHQNFSKVSYGTLDLDITGFSASEENVKYQIDVYGVYYNWLTVKDGRGYLAFN